MVCLLFAFALQGARGFPGTPGLPGMKGHRVSVEPSSSSYSSFSPDPVDKRRVDSDSETPKMFVDLLISPRSEDL